MKTITINGWIQCKPAASWDTNQIDGLKYDFFQHEDMTNCGHAMVTPYTMTFEVPDSFNPNATFVEALKEKKKELQAEFQKRITEIQSEINKLTAISYEVEA